MNWAPQLIVDSKTRVYQHTRTTKEVQFMVQKMMCELNDTIWSDLDFPPLYTNVQIAFVPWKSWWKNYKLKDCQLCIASSEVCFLSPWAQWSPFSHLSEDISGLISSRHLWLLHRNPMDNSFAFSHQTLALLSILQLMVHIASSLASN
jgi:hypothetical protein